MKYTSLLSLAGRRLLKFLQLALEEIHQNSQSRAVGWCSPPADSRGQ